MTLRTITTKSNQSFIYDDTSLSKNNDILTCNFLMLRCIKMIQQKIKDNGKPSYTYQYPSIIFRNLNMCNGNQILSSSTASEIEITIFRRVSANKPLGKELNKYLRDHYMIEMSYSDSEE